MEVQAALDKDPRIESARFALTVSHFGRFSNVAHGVPYHVVLTTIKPVTKEVAAEIIMDAFKTSDVRVNQKPRLIQYDGSWATGDIGGVCYITKDEIPDMSTLETNDQ